jgi:IMP dehydrogenase/GMP reductase
MSQEVDKNQLKATFSNPLDAELLSADDILLAPRLGLLNSRSEAELYPFIYSAPMDTVTGTELAEAMLSAGEYPVMCRFLKEEWSTAISRWSSNSNVFFAIGIKDVETIQSLPLSKTNPTSIAVDVAHGDSEQTLNAIRNLATFPEIGNIMSGSICTPDAALRALEAGATHLRVGVGPGSVCITRQMTGCGVPQLSAIYLINKILCEQGVRDRVTLIADGGIRTPGDAVKYLAAGADAIMLGSRFSRCEESAGWTSCQHFETGIVRKTKSYRGQASTDFQKEVLDKLSACPEGKATEVFTPDRTCGAIIEEFRGGVASALSYLGVQSLRELVPENTTFLKVTPAAYLEGRAHGTE